MPDDQLAELTRFLGFELAERNISRARLLSELSAELRDDAERRPRTLAGRRLARGYPTAA